MSEESKQQQIPRLSRTGSKKKIVVDKENFDRSCFQDGSQTEEKKKQKYNILLLGAGAVGKSTLFSQFIRAFKAPMGVEFRKGYRSILRANLITQMQALLNVNQADVSHIASELLPFVQSVTALTYSSVYPNPEHIISLWADPSMSDRVDKARRHLHNIDYIFASSTKIRELCDLEYVPTEQDVLHARWRTLGILETDFTLNNNQFRVYDTGGERNERRKWMHVFPDASCIVFVVNLHGYCLSLYEDESVNSLVEDLVLFEEIVNSKHFKQSLICLLFNQKDKFKSAIETNSSFVHQEINRCLDSVLPEVLLELIHPYLTYCYPLNAVFPEYQGGPNYEKALSFVKEQFLRVDRRDEFSPPLLTFDTCAVDSSATHPVLVRILSEVTGTRE